MYEKKRQKNTKNHPELAAIRQGAIQHPCFSFDSLGRRYLKLKVGGWHVSQCADCPSCFPGFDNTGGYTLSDDESGIKRVPFTCTLDCGGRCELIACVRDGELVRIDTPPGRPDTVEMPRLVPCLRGRAQGRLQQTRERVLTPLRRVGPRGGDQFDEVSWDEALDEVAQRLVDTRDRHGAEAILHITGAGSFGGRGFSGGAASHRFFSHWASVTATYGNMSMWCAQIANQWMLGDTDDSIDIATLLESRLIVLWAMNPAENRLGGNLAYFIVQARDRGARVILIDPRFTDTAILADQWIPIRPGTDVAFIAAIAHVWITEGRVDTGFMEAHTVGYKDYFRYVLGEEDGIPKTPEWAAEISEVPVETIRAFAREYASAKPAALMAGLGPQRTRFGEQTERALITLVCMSGNMGIRGGGLAHKGRHSSASIPTESLSSGPCTPVQKVRAENWGKFVLDGNLDPPAKMAYIVASNAINRSAGTRANARALEQLDFVVVHDQYFTPTARYADIVFPICLDLERPDLVQGRGDLHYNRQALEARGETRTDHWVFSRLAERLGIGEAYTGGKTEEEWLGYFLEASGLDTGSLKREGILRSTGEPRVHLAEFRADPAGHPLDTLSGRIEVACTKAEEYGLPPIPSYIENRPAAEEKEYPLRLVTPHSKLRANSSGYPNAWLLRLEPQRVWMNPQDAQTRGIEPDELVEIFNGSGVIAIPAKVTERIMPGVVAVNQGAWYRPGEDGVDTGGCANSLTSHRVSRTGGLAVHSERVQIRRRVS